MGIFRLAEGLFSLEFACSEDLMGKYLAYIVFLA